MAFLSTKTYGHDVGLSAVFRQWRADSHCRLMHGYALSINIKFAAKGLDRNGWVIDFGGLKDFKSALQNTFDHKCIVAKDDPAMDYFQQGERRGLLELVVVDGTGCEAFAKLVYEMATRWLEANSQSPRCSVASVEVREHGANSAIYTGDDNGS